ncbi:hypothetical protein AB4144_31450, partial [Rhizobiaceae sp. 2RAB30]
GTLQLLNKFRCMVRNDTYTQDPIERIRRDIRRIRAYIQSLPEHGNLTDVDTLLSVAESEASRQSAPGPNEDDVQDAPLENRSAFVAVWNRSKD